ncbi:hypothetical protein A3C21_02900 [Candidatus Kaiserbacteria bacterium RIFCSPHIGHO2_02_FULL_59_21]|uniref:Nucleotidyltransferase family protein n=2 Tax=Candidatus Kaiseribacteriota TaxID=1752734 RepID=A0A0G1YQZ7_9BACT|nr:MAG: Nucleotidyltransferase family protein [Candidatus Kaiserbacteria bacterium GW2011_GWA2_58_9]OGG63387.1 MAG: hypothetical protein A2766_04040 [Candidatus Kaiserbacteria bacterium RIFCSPHIGHO2_01_FULL_58_22]OGG66612.1 MAG: hypothetical protein A3C21_02900 [Candidatus Kaiserbacteria bacterium RIFCSPHIGHO2_02_FULL_59_21]OGG79013.1 MAG: hypothetical protein A2952_01455 [Candidatus Kaiserbacteria bacterium RIFCSPLOWO2_01_FULL_59_34]OGG84363.1 MAG: hypothetical protein A3I47_01750 [Candidatus 
MKAIIIAAGKGRRLSPLTDHVPKNLLDIGGTTILEMQIEALTACGINEIAIVVGHGAEQIDAALEKHKNLCNITLVYNPYFDVADNLVSVWSARHLMDNEFISVNGDNIFTPAVVQRLLQHPGNTAMVIDTKASYDADDMKVIHDVNGVREVSKTINPANATAESAGIIKFSKAGATLYRNVLEEIAQKRANKNAYYLEAIREVIARGHTVHYSECEEDDWCELDVPSDLEKMRQSVRKLKECVPDVCSGNVRV